MDWIHLAEDSNKDEHNNEPFGSVKGGEFND